jgi:hypothetical protein
MSLFENLVRQAMQARPELAAVQAVVEKELLHHDILREMAAGGFPAGLNEGHPLEKELSLTPRLPAGMTADSTRRVGTALCLGVRPFSRCSILKGWDHLAQGCKWQSLRGWADWECPDAPGAGGTARKRPRFKTHSEKAKARPIMTA